MGKNSGRVRTSAALSRERGQSLVEFALVVPILLLLVFGIAEFGRAWMSQNILTGAAREAVRLLAVPPGSITPQDRADNVLRSGGITTATVSVDDPGAPFGPVSVTINYDFPVVVVGFIPGLNGLTFPLTSSTTMRREY